MITSISILMKRASDASNVNGLLIEALRVIKGDDCKELKIKWLRNKEFISFNKRSGLSLNQCLIKVFCCKESERKNHDIQMIFKIAEMIHKDTGFYIRVECVDAFVYDTRV